MANWHGQQGKFCGFFQVNTDLEYSLLFNRPVDKVSLRPCRIWPRTRTLTEEEKSFVGSLV